jgi:hypothetical protein
MKSFYLYRTEDESGISGTGRVAQGFVADNGKAALFWLSEHPSVTVYDSVGEVQAIHGHSGKTELRYEPDYKRAFNEMKEALNGATLLDAVSGRLPHEGASKKMLDDTE